MSALKTLRKLVFGETWLLPIGIALTLGGAGLLRRALGAHWPSAGGFVLLTAIGALMVVSVRRTAARP